MKTATEKTHELMIDLDRRGIVATFEQAHTLRRAELTLHRWNEQECGDGNDYQSWAIERDEATDKPYMCVYPHRGESRRYAIPDKEAGAKRRVGSVCAELGLTVHYQTDPRGAALYVSLDPTMDDTNYNTRGVCCGIR